MRWTTSLQPFLGHVADRTDTRYWVILTPATTATIVVGAVGDQVGLRLALVGAIVVGLSSAPFVPMIPEPRVRSRGV